MGKHAKARPPRRTARTAAAIAVVGTVVTGPTLAFANGAKAATSSEWDSVAQCEAGGAGLWQNNWSSDGLSVGGLQFQNPSWQDALSYLSGHGYDVSGFPQSLHQGMSNVPTKDEQILAGEALLHLQGSVAWTTVSDGCASLGTSMFDGGPNPWGLSGTSWPGAGGSMSTPPPASGGGSQASSGDQGSSGEGEDGGSSSAPVASEGEDGGSDTAAEPASAPASAPSAPAPVASTASAPASTHTVVKGEWLIKIAEQYYGDWTKWQLIYNANVGVIGSNPDLIFPGQVLTLPAG